MERLHNTIGNESNTSSADTLTSTENIKVFAQEEEIPFSHYFQNGCGIAQVIEGAVKIVHPNKIKLLLAGETFGYSQDISKSTKFISCANSKISILSSDAMINRCSEDKEFLTKTINQFLLTHAKSQINIHNMPVKVRFLIVLREHMKITKNKRFQNFLTQADWALMIETARETFNRAISELTEDKIINYTKSYIEILDYEKLLFTISDYFFTE